MTLVAIILAFLINIIITPIIIQFAHRYKWYDLPDHRKVHTGLIPRLGGVGIFSSFLISALATSFILYMITGKLSGILNLNFIPVFTAFVLIHITGLVDDFHSQRALLKLIIQIVAAILVTMGGFLINSITIPYIGTISFGILAYPITVFWIIAITNAVNLVDGMDGLAGGIGAFAAFSMGFISLLSGQVEAAIISFALFGAIAAFLVFNLPPARIFMGDSGSLILGFVLSVVPLVGITKTPSFNTIVVPVTLLLIPIIDTVVAIIRRVRAKRTIMSPDKDHLHHKLLDMGFNEKKILVLIYSVCLYLSIIAITSTIMPKDSNIYVIVIVWAGCMMGYGLIHYLNAKKIVLPVNSKIERKNSA